VIHVGCSGEVVLSANGISRCVLAKALAWIVRTF